MRKGGGIKQSNIGSDSVHPPPNEPGTCTKDAPDTRPEWTGTISRARVCTLSPPHELEAWTARTLWLARCPATTLAPQGTGHRQADGQHPLRNDWQRKRANHREGLPDGVRATHGRGRTQAEGFRAERPQRLFTHYLTPLPLHCLTEHSCTFQPESQRTRDGHMLRTHQRYLLPVCPSPSLSSLNY